MTRVDSPRVAVALEYRRGTHRAPRVTATGRGAVAERILAVAEENGVPLQENAALAEALSRVPLDDEIPEELYRAVAEVLSFVLRVTRRV